MKHTTISTYKNIEREYELKWSVEAGLALWGTEVKALRRNSPSLTNCYCTVMKNHVILKQLTNRDIQLLLHKKQIQKLNGMYSKKGVVIVVRELYDKNGRIKAEIIPAERITKFDKRQNLIKREIIKRSKYDLI